MFRRLSGDLIVDGNGNTLGKPPICRQSINKEVYRVEENVFEIQAIKTWIVTPQCENLTGTFDGVIVSQGLQKSGTPPSTFHSPVLVYVIGSRRPIFLYHVLVIQESCIASHLFSYVIITIKNPASENILSKTCLVRIDSKGPPTSERLLGVRITLRVIIQFKMSSIWISINTNRLQFQPNVSNSNNESYQTLTLSLNPIFLRKAWTTPIDGFR